jgi:hypothetical protein
LRDESADESTQESEDGSQQESGPPPPVVKVDASYLVRVNDAEAARRLLAERGSTQEYSAAVTTDVVTDLFLADGWDPHQYGEEIIEVLEQKWACGPDEWPKRPTALRESQPGPARSTRAGPERPAGERDGTQCPVPETAGQRPRRVQRGCLGGPAPTMRTTARHARNL